MHVVAKGQVILSSKFSKLMSRATWTTLILEVDENDNILLVNMTNTVVREHKKVYQTMTEKKLLRYS